MAKTLWIYRSLDVFKPEDYEAEGVVCDHGGAEDTSDLLSQNGDELIDYALTNNKSLVRVVGQEAESCVWRPSTDEDRKWGKSINEARQHFDYITEYDNGSWV